MYIPLSPGHHGVDTTRAGRNQTGFFDGASVRADPIGNAPIAPEILVAPSNLVRQHLVRGLEEAGTNGGAQASLNSSAPYSRSLTSP